MATIKLVKGKTYAAWTTHILRDVRGFREVTFIASRDQEVEEFIRGDGRIPQDRVFRWYEDFGSVPVLVVAGSIKEVQ